MCKFPDYNEIFNKSKELIQNYSNEFDSELVKRHHKSCFDLLMDKFEDNPHLLDLMNNIVTNDGGQLVSYISEVIENKFHSTFYSEFVRNQRRSIYDC